MMRFGPKLNPSPPQRRADALPITPQTRVNLYMYKFMPFVAWRTNYS